MSIETLDSDLIHIVPQEDNGFYPLETIDEDGVPFLYEGQVEETALDDPTENATKDHFFQEFTENAARLQELGDSYSHGLNVSDDEKRMIEAARFFNSVVVRGFRHPTHRLQLMDRAQTGFLIAFEAIKRTFDPAKSPDGKAISFLAPHANHMVKTVEERRGGDINHSDIISVPTQYREYFAVRNMMEAMAISDSPLVDHPEELTQFRNFTFTDEDAALFNELHKTHEPFDDIFGPETNKDIAPHEPNDPHSETSKSIQTNGVGRALSLLNERQRKVLIFRLGLLDDEGSKTLKEIAEELGVSHQRISQIEQEALDRIRKIPNILDVILLGDSPAK